MRTAKSGKDAIARIHRVLVIDDHEIIYNGIKDTLEGENDMVVCGLAKTGAEILPKIAQTAPSVLLLDLKLPDGNGLDLMASIRKSNPEVAIIILSVYDDFIHVERALRAGARGFLTKSDETALIAKAIRGVAGGEIFLSERSRKTLLESVADGQDLVASPLNLLSNRELAIYEQLGQGQTRTEVARNVGISNRTVGAYEERLKKKLHLTSTHALIAHAARWAALNDGG